jgi:hypothetical protein
LLLIELTGRRSGRFLSLPVAYRRTAPDELRVHVGGWERKLWWRNLQEPTRVAIWLQGDRLSAIGQARREQGAVAVVLQLSSA